MRRCQGERGHFYRLDCLHLKSLLILIHLSISRNSFTVSSRFLPRPDILISPPSLVKPPSYSYPHPVPPTLPIATHFLPHQLSPSALPTYRHPYAPRLHPRVPPIVPLAPKATFHPHPIPSQPFFSPTVTLTPSIPPSTRAWDCSGNGAISSLFRRHQKR